MALASLDGLVFRINPNAVQWNFAINTGVTETLGGRVVQVLGATLSDMTVTGDFGQDHSRHGDDGLSWKLAEAFLEQMTAKMERQRTLSQTQGQRGNTLPVLRFVVPDYGWDFNVYIKSLASRSGSDSVTHTVGSVNYGYRLTLFIVEDRTDTLAAKKNDAIGSYLARVSQGVGWRLSAYNDPADVANAVFGDTKAVTPPKAPDPPPPSPPATPAPEPAVPDTPGLSVGP